MPEYDELWRLYLAKDREADALRRQLVTMQDELMGELAKANERIAQLLVLVERGKKRTSKKVSTPTADPPPELTEDQRAVFDARPEPPPARGLPHLHPRPRQKPTGRKPLPDSLPATVSERRPQRCRCGCEDFTWVDEIVEEKLDVHAHQRRRVTHRHTGKCRQCGRRTTGEAPPSPFARSKVTCEWLAWLVNQKFQLLVPLDRVRRYLGAQGLALSMSFLVSQTAHAARLLEAIDGEHWKRLLAGDQLATDGTNFKVQIRGAGLQHAYLEVYHHDDVVVFQFELEKSGATQASKLTPFEGVLLVDAESRYNETAALPGVIEANCHAHPRRKLKDAVQMQPVLAADGGRFITEFFDIEAEGRERGLAGDDIVAWRREHAAPILDEFRVWSDAVYPTLLPDDPLAKVIRYYRKHWAELTVCLEHPVRIDNSGSERLFQPVAKLRHNSLFAGAPEGGHRSAVLLGIAATCQRLGVDLEAYLTWVFERRGTHSKKYELPAAELTPAAYAQAIAEG